MDQQLALFETPEPLPNRYRLFVGIFPDAESVDLICDQQTALREKFGLRGKFHPRNILHVTMHHIGDYSEVSERIIETAAKACEAAFAGQPSIEVTFDHVMSFGGHPGNLPFVLVKPNGNQRLMELHHRLITELAKRKLASRGDFKFLPHVTLLYDRQNVLEQPVSPVTWRTNEVVLVLSHLGETRYERLRCWALSE
jgi:2'-5' RNA ligase